MKTPQNRTPMPMSPIENIGKATNRSRQIGLLASRAKVHFRGDFVMTDENLIDAHDSSKNADENRQQAPQQLKGELD